MKKNYAFLLCLLPLSAMGSWFAVTTENLPNTLVVGQKYSGIAFKIKNTSKGTIKNLKINGVQSPPEFSLMGSIGQCHNALAPGDACTVIRSGQYSSNSIGTGKAEWSFNFTDGVEKYSKRVVRKVATTGTIGTITTNLPANVEEAFKYPIVYTFQSIGTETKNITVIKPTIGGLHLTNNCPSTLAPNAVCTVSGEYIAPASATGQTIRFPVTLRYNQGETIDLTLHTKVGHIAVNGSVTKAPFTNSLQGMPIELMYTFTNDSGGNATGVRLKLPLPVGNLRLTHNCDPVLAPHTMCTVSGTYTPSARKVGQTVSFPVTLRYDQGAPVELTTSTKIGDIAVNGKVTKAPPANAPEGVKFELVYTFTNYSTGSATGVDVRIPSISGLSLKSNCPVTLAPHAECSVSGEYTPSARAVGQTISFPVTLRYNQGAPIELVRTTKVTKAKPIYAFITGETPSPIKCLVDRNTGKFYNCKDSTATAISNTRGITLNAARTRAFVIQGNSVMQCSIDPETRNLSGCSNTGATNLNTPRDITLNPTGTHAFIINGSNKFGVSKIIKCNVDSATGKFSACSNTDATDIRFPAAITLNATGTHVFIINSRINRTITTCNVDPATGKFSACTRMGPKPRVSAVTIAITLNAASTRAFISTITTDTTTNVIKCTVDPATGSLSDCSDTGATNFVYAIDITLNATGTRAFITDYDGNKIIECAVDPTTGDFSACANTGATALNNPIKTVLL